MTAGGRVDVRPLCGRSEIRRFIQFPFGLYHRHPHWVPPLLMDRMAFFDFAKNPFYRTAEVALWMAYRHGEPVGRIAACVNADHNEFHHERTGSFGFFEAIDDDGVAAALLDAATSWVAERGMERILGPLNFSTNHEVGMLIDPFDVPPVVMMPYNPPHYPGLIEKQGFAKAKDVLAYLVTRQTPPPERVRKIAARVQERAGVQIRDIDLRRFEEEIERVRQIYNQAWSRNWGFVPLREDEFQHIARDMKLIIEPRLALMAEVEGRPVGFSLTIPNIYESQIKIRNGRLLPFGALRLFWDLKVRRAIRGVRTITMGVVHDYQKRGIESIFYIETTDRAIELGYDWSELSWILEDNEMMIRAAEALGGRCYRRYRIYHKKI